MIVCANPSAQFDSYQTEIEEAVLEVMRSNRYVLGEEVASLEKEFADYIETTSAIGVANATDAIELALRFKPKSAGRGIFCQNSGNYCCSLIWPICKFRCNQGFL